MIIGENMLVYGYVELLEKLAFQALGAAFLRPPKYSSGGRAGREHLQLMLG